jgi:hypothetical protein
MSLRNLSVNIKGINRTVVQAEPGELCCVDIIHERHIGGWCNAGIQNAAGRNRVCWVVKFGAVDISSGRDIEQICLPSRSRYIQPASHLRYKSKPNILIFRFRVTATPAVPISSQGEENILLNKLNFARSESLSFAGER